MWYLGLVFASPYRSAQILRRVQRNSNITTNKNTSADSNNSTSSNINIKKSSNSTDRQGYLVQETMSDNDPTRPQYQLPSLAAKSPLTTMRLITALPKEGILALFKGHGAAVALTGINATMQPAMEHALLSLLSINDNLPLRLTYRISARMGIRVFAHTATRIITGPLDLVLTRYLLLTQNGCASRWQISEVHWCI